MLSFSEFSFLVEELTHISLYRGEPSSNETEPKERSHEGGVFFYNARDKKKALGYSKGLSGKEQGKVYKLRLPRSTATKLADLNDDKTYHKLLPIESDRSSPHNRGVMPSTKLVTALNHHGYTGYKWDSPQGSREHFVLSKHLNGLKYE